MLFPDSVNDFLFDIHPDCTLEILRSFINEMNQGMVLLPKNVLHRLLVLVRVVFLFELDFLNNALTFFSIIQPMMDVSLRNQTQGTKEN